MAANVTVVGGTDVPSPLRVTSDVSDAVNAQVKGSTDGGSAWVALRVNSAGHLRVVASGEQEDDAGMQADVTATLSGAGTLNTGAAVTVSSIALLEGERLIIRRLLATIGGTTAASAPFVIVVGAVTKYTAQVNNGVPVEVAGPLAPLVIEGPAGGVTVYLKFNTATSASVYGVICQAVKL